MYKRQELFTYSGLDLLLKRYVIQSRSRVPLETPQEMFLGIALHLAMNDRLWLSDRGHWAEYQDLMGYKRKHESAALSQAPLCHCTL